MIKQTAKLIKILRLLLLSLVVTRSLYSCVFTPLVLPPALLTPATLSAEDKGPPAVVSDHLRVVTLDPKQLTGSFSLTLFDNTTYIALVDRVEEQGKGHFVWMGHLAGQQGSQVKVTVQDQVVRGVIELDNNHYELQRLHDNLYVLYERNPLT